MKKQVKKIEKQELRKVSSLNAIKGGTNGKGTKRAASSASGKPELL